MTPARGLQWAFRFRMVRGEHEWSGGMTLRVYAWSWATPKKPKIWCAPKIPDAILADHNTTFWQSTQLRWLRWLTHIYFAPCLTIESKFQILRSKSTMEHPVFIQLIPSNNSRYFYWERGVSIAILVHWMEVLALACPDAWRLLRGFPCELPSLAMLCILTCQRLVSCTPRLDGLWEKKTTIDGDIMGMRRVYIIYIIYYNHN